MYEVQLKNNKSFSCEASATIFKAAQQSNIHLEHSCLTARCRSCVAKVISGEYENVNDEFVLSKEEKENNFILTCNTIPKSDLRLDIEDLGNITLYSKKIFPSKIDAIKYLTEDVVKVSLRLPPKVQFQFNAGQYVNLIKDGITRSYSLANFSDSKLEFFIKNYKGGQMSNYWFNNAKLNDLIRVEGPLGTFFLRESKCKYLVFLGTGTGVAPIKSILDHLENNLEIITNKEIYIFNGARFQKDLFWTPQYENFNFKYISVLSREEETFNGYKGYVQDALLHENINLNDAQVYACGSSEMINSAKKLLQKNKLPEHQFFSDAFVQTN